MNTYTYGQLRDLLIDAAAKRGAFRALGAVLEFTLSGKLENVMACHYDELYGALAKLISGAKA